MSSTGKLNLTRSSALSADILLNPAWDNGGLRAYSDNVYNAKSRK